VTGTRGKVVAVISAEDCEAKRGRIEEVWAMGQGGERCAQPGHSVKYKLDF
jgi:hypothetical protein